MGSLSILTLTDGTEIAQQKKMMRLIRKEMILCPSDHVAAAKVDEVMGIVEDLFTLIAKIGQGLEKYQKEAARKAEFKESRDAHNTLKKVDSLVAKNYASRALAGDQLAITDVFVCCACNVLVSGFFDGVLDEALNVFENLTIFLQYTCLQKNAQAQLHSSFS